MGLDPERECESESERVVEELAAVASYVPFLTTAMFMICFQVLGPLCLLIVDVLSNGFDNSMLGRLVKELMALKDYEEWLDTVSRIVPAFS